MTSRILNPQVLRGLHDLGHTDLLLVTDAGFPLPQGVDTVDLSLVPGIPLVTQILRAVQQEIYVEKVTFAPEVKTHNPRLYEEVQSIYTGSGAEFDAASHEALCNVESKKAKFVIRSGDLQPWGNFLLTVSTDPFAWFTDESVEKGLKILPEYVDRRKRIENKEVPELNL